MTINKESSYNNDGLGKNLEAVTWCWWKRVMKEMPSERELF